MMFLRFDFSEVVKATCDDARNRHSTAERRREKRALESKWL